MGVGAFLVITTDLGIDVECLPRDTLQCVSEKTLAPALPIPVSRRGEAMRAGALGRGKLVRVGASVKEVMR